MADIRNHLTWSFSRQQVFESCELRYFYRYYQFWGGWGRGAPQESRTAYLFSKMQTLPMLIGSAVHQVIEDLLRSHQKGRPLKDPVQRLRDRLNNAWRDSKNRGWESVGPKRCPPLFEHYYDRPPTRDQLTELRELALRCLDNFLNSELFADMQQRGPASWRAIEELSVLPVTGVDAYIAPDFCYDRDGETWILDWKTGAPREDMSLQLRAYALYAVETWRIPAERVRAFDVFLGGTEGAVLQEVEISEDSLEEARQAVGQSIATMKNKLQAPEQNLAVIEDFAPTTDAHTCDQCFFQGMCNERAVETAATSAA